MMITASGTCMIAEDSYSGESGHPGLPLAVIED